MKYNKILIILIIILTPFHANGVSYTSKSPEELTNTICVRITSIFETEEINRQLKITNNLMSQYFNFNTFAHLTLQNHWNTILWNQRKIFLKLFQENFIQNVANKLIKQRVRSCSCKAVSSDIKNNWSKVNSKLFYNNKSIDLTWVWQFENEKWKVVDLRSSGSSLSGNYQAQFNRIIDEKGIENLLHSLRNKLIKQGAHP